jgi:hypothetical protein
MRFSLKHALTGTLLIAVIAWAATSCAHLYELYGAVQSVLYPLLLVMVFFLSFPFVLNERFRKAWTVTWLVALLLFSWRLNSLHNRLNQLRKEVGSIVAHLEQHLERNGTYPSNLANYQFERPELAEYVEYELVSENRGYALTFHPKSRGPWGIYHGYTPDEGYWYQDD